MQADSKLNSAGVIAARRPTWIYFTKQKQRQMSSIELLMGNMSFSHDKHNHACRASAAHRQG